MTIVGSTTPSVAQGRRTINDEAPEGDLVEIHRNLKDPASLYLPGQVVKKDWRTLAFNGTSTVSPVELP